MTAPVAEFSWGARRTRFAAVALPAGLASVLLVLAGASPAGANAGPATATSGPAASAPTSARSCDPIVGFDRAGFPAHPKINNRFFPLVPGTQLVLEGRANRGGGVLPHEVVFTVTDLVKVIDGVKTVVLWDQDINEGKLREAELAFFAQDKHGNVWSLGEYPEEYNDKGEFIGAPSTWIPGQDGAKGGVMMLSQPKVGTPRYLQGSAPAVEFLDCARVFKTGQRTCVPVDCYRGVLVTDEDSPLDKASGHQRKFYAPGVGNVRVEPVNDPEGETLVLTKLKHLGPKALDDARAKALKLEKRAYQVSDVYRRTEPARRAG